MKSSISPRCSPPGTPLGQIGVRRQLTSKHRVQGWERKEKTVKAFDQTSLFNCVRFFERKRKN